VRITTYKPDGTNHKSEMKRRVDNAIAVFETAYINGNSVIVGDATADMVITIDHNAIPYFVEGLRVRLLK
jgi:hypothetical protein